MEPEPTANNTFDPQLIEQAHALYCELTGQNILLRINWQRSWFELLRYGFSLEDVRQVVRYLQKEIRHDRRNIGALKLSNLLQPDRFEEDLNISRVCLQNRPTRTPEPKQTRPAPPLISPQEASAQLHKLRENLRPPSKPQ